MSDENPLAVFGARKPLADQPTTRINFTELKFLSEHFIMKRAIDILQGRTRHNFDEALQAYRRLGLHFTRGGHRQYAHAIWLIAVAYQNGIDPSRIPPTVLEEGRSILMGVKLNEQWRDSLLKYAKGE